MNTIESIEYIVRGSGTEFCIVESMKASDGKTYERGIGYGLTQDVAQTHADNFQALFDGLGRRPTVTRNH
jgi:hypothetical protein